MLRNEVRAAISAAVDREAMTLAREGDAEWNYLFGSGGVPECESNAVKRELIRQAEHSPYKFNAAPLETVRSHAAIEAGIRLREFLKRCANVFGTAAG